MNKWIITLLTVVIFLLIVIFILQSDKQQVQYKDQIDSLNLESVILNHKRDSISHKIDTVVIKLKENEIVYKETTHSIINNTVNEDYIFFVNYLKQHKERFDSIINSDSIKVY